MAKLSLDLSSGTLHPRENVFGSGNLSALNAAVQIKADGASSVGLVVTGPYVGTLVVEGSADGANWDSIPVRPVSLGGLYVITLASAAIGRWQGGCAPFSVVRVRMSAYTSGTAAVRVTADVGVSEVLAFPRAADLSVTVTAAAAAAATLTIPAVAGQFHYFTRITVQRFAAALLTAGATPVLVTTTNLPGSRVFSIPADAAAAGTMWAETVGPSQPLRSSAANTATTIVAPATTSVIWRITADYYTAP